jgi:glycosyltransferase involved in cell wall biosynthesis
MGTTKLKYLFLQCQASQLDAPFYGALARHLPGGCLVILFNDSGNQRKDVDPELGFTPVFPDLDEGYPTEWVHSGTRGLIGLLKRISHHNPACVVLQDQTWRDKLILALVCRILRIRVAMRSDKNVISDGTRSGLALWVERFLIKRLFNVLCPVSEMTTTYYDWKDDRAVWMFPYCTNEKKFKPPNDPTPTRRSIRFSFGIPEDAFVFLTVAKFVDRENPRGMIDSFERLVISHPNAWLLMVGAGPQFEEIQHYVNEKKIPNISFAGYVSYAVLEQYHFAADVFLHLAKCEPWGMSPQDALVSGMGLIVSNKVGSGIRHLGKELSRFVVPLNDIDGTVERMAELIRLGRPQELFQPARASVLNGFTTESLAIQWAEPARN